MSTTAGVGLGDYRAVNSLAVAALVLGVASWVSWLHPTLYVVPLMALVFGIVSLVQIRRSNGTQSGVVLAACGLALALGLGGWAFASEVQQRREIARHRSEISAYFAEFGRLLEQGQYDAAYELLHPNFQSEISRDAFVRFVAAEDQRAGGVRAGRTNQLAQVDATGGQVMGNAVLILETGQGEPLRQPVRLVRTEEGWRILEFGIWFPRAYQMPSY